MRNITCRYYNPERARCEFSKARCIYKGESSLCNFYRQIVTQVSDHPVQRKITSFEDIIDDLMLKK